MITLDAQVWNLIIGALLPALVAFVTKREASPRVKSTALAVLTVVSSVAVEFAARGAFSGRDLLTALVVQYVTSQTAYAALLRPAGVTAAIAGLKPDLGLGSVEVAQVAEVAPQTAGANEFSSDPDTPATAAAASGGAADPVVPILVEEQLSELLNWHLDKGTSVVDSLRLTADELEQRGLQ